MMKKLVAGAVALTVAGAGLALAQQMPSRDSTRWRPNTEDAAAFADARIAALKAGLRLSAEQDKLWPAVEAALRDLARQRAEHREERRKRWAERMDERRSGERGDRMGRGDRADRADRSDRADRTDRDRGADMIARLRRGADALSTRGASLKKLADAAEPLYQSLDDGQKRRLALLMRMGRDGGDRPGRWHRGDERGRWERDEGPRHWRRGEGPGHWQRQVDNHHFDDESSDGDR